MKRTGTIYLGLIAFLLVAWLLPRLWHVITVEGYRNPFTLYSCVIDDFASVKDFGSRDLILEDRNGKEYGDTVLALFYYRSLIGQGTMPESIKGVPITIDAVEHDRIFFSTETKTVNRDKQNVFLLMESRPARAELEEPEYVFVLQEDGLEIVEVEGKRSDDAMSEAFTAALRDKGFVFPAALVNGTPSDRKSYDEGYLLTDAEGKLFKLKMAEGRPVVDSYPLPEGLVISHIFIAENENRASIAYLTDSENAFWIVSPAGEFVKTEVRIDPTEEELMLVGDIFNYTVQVSGDKGCTYWALDSKTYDCVAKMERSYPEPTKFDLPKYVLPFELSFTSSDNSYVTPRFHSFSWIGLLFDIIVACLVIFLRKK